MTTLKKAAATVSKAAGGVSQKLTDLRERIAALHAERGTIEATMLTMAEGRERLADWVDKQAARYPEHSNIKLFRYPHPISSVDTDSIAPHSSNHHLRYDVQFLCFVLGDTVKSRLGELLEYQTGKEPGLSTAERTERFESIASELDSLETEEERLIREAEDSGIYIDRRANARPEIVLAD